MSETLTVKELAARIDGDPEQIRYWTRQGWLDTEGERHTGRGRSRQYAPCAVYWASLLMDLSHFSAPSLIMHTAALYCRATFEGVEKLVDAHVAKDDHFRAMRLEDYQQMADAMLAAIEGERAVYLKVLAYYRHEGPTRTTRFHVHYDTLPAIERSAIVVNLTALWGSLQ